jgi:uncharacterized protein (TIGR04255 family)
MMPRKVLKNKPLVEAIFEVKWSLKELSQGLRIDPHYKILVGSLYSKVKGEYPFHEMLPAAAIPDDIAGHVIQHRFRKGKNQWPLLQTGPGILTVNDTDGYVWEEFEQKVVHATAALFETYPEPETLAIESILLRYIDAVEFNFSSSDIFSFLSEKMKTTVRPYDGLFKETSVDSVPLSFDLRFSFPSEKPSGIIHLRFLRGKRENADALIWETMVQSPQGQVASMPEGIGDWLNDAHNLTDDWFFKLIAGDLERRFE